MELKSSKDTNGSDPRMLAEMRALQSSLLEEISMMRREAIQNESRALDAAKSTAEGQSVRCNELKRLQKKVKHHE